MGYCPVPPLFALEFLKKIKKSYGAITSQSLFSPRLEFGWAFVYTTQLEVPLQPPMVVIQLRFPSVLAFSALHVARLLTVSVPLQLCSLNWSTASSLGPLFSKLTDLMYLNTSCTQQIICIFSHLFFLSPNSYLANVTIHPDVFQTIQFPEVSLSSFQLLRLAPMMELPVSHNV